MLGQSSKLSKKANGLWSARKIDMTYNEIQDDPGLVCERRLHDARVSA